MEVNSINHPERIMQGKGGVKRGVKEVSNNTAVRGGYCSSRSIASLETVGCRSTRYDRGLEITG